MSFRVKPIVQLSFVQCRSFTTSEVRHGKRNFRKFLMPNVRGTFHDRARKDRIIETYGYREPGIERGNRLEMVPEMEPELVVPDLEGFQLKLYVSYRAAEVCQGKSLATCPVLGASGQGLQGRLPRSRAPHQDCV
ncbi:39S ribosomal protein L41, mitochondrial [Ixodes scapularis]